MFVTRRFLGVTFLLRRLHDPFDVLDLKQGAPVPMTRCPLPAKVVRCQPYRSVSHVNQKPRGPLPEKGCQMSTWQHVPLERDGLLVKRKRFHQHCQRYSPTITVFSTWLIMPVVTCLSQSASVLSTCTLHLRTCNQP